MGTACVTPVSMRKAKRILPRVLRFSSIAPQHCSDRGISAYSFADRNVISDDVTDVAVLTVVPTDLVSGSNHGGPHRSCGPLRDGLPLEWRHTICRELL